MYVLPMLGLLKEGEGGCSWLQQYHCLSLVFKHHSELDELYQEQIVEWCQADIHHLLLTYIILYGTN